MSTVFNIQAPKKPTNVSINSDLLLKAKALKINLSAALESTLTELVVARQNELWKAENRAAIDAYNRLVDEQGSFGDQMRSF